MAKLNLNFQDPNETSTSTNNSFGGFVKDAVVGLGNKVSDILPGLRVGVGKLTGEDTTPYQQKLNQAKEETSAPIVVKDLSGKSKLNPAGAKGLTNLVMGVTGGEDIVNSLGNLAKEKSIPAIQGLLKKSFPYLDDKVVEAVSPAISKATKPEEVNAILKKAHEVVNRVPTLEEAIPKNIHPDDLGVMRDFTDAVNGSYKPEAGALANLKQDAQRIAEKYNFSKFAEGDKALSNEFGSYLDNIGLDKKIVSESPINLKRLNISPEAKDLFENLPQDVKTTLQDVKGGVLTNKEVEEAANYSSVLTKATSRESTLKSEAALLKTRQNLAALAEGKSITPDFVDNLRVVSAEAARRGRELQALSIGADPSLNTIKSEIVQKLLDLGKSTDEILKASEGLDLTNMKDLTKFYREFVPATFGEKLNEYRYINLLSSPKTHIVNAFSNALQGGFLNPTTKLVSGGIDAIRSALTGKAREAYVKEVPAYFKGAFNSIGDAVSSFSKAMDGSLPVQRPDIKSIPTGAKMLKPFQAIPRFLEAADVFFKTIITGGEKESLAYKYSQMGKEVSQEVIDKEAQDSAQYWIFRQALDPANKTGQGKLLSEIDKLTTNIYRLRDVKGVKWFIPFVQTPMNILKQGIEFSPAGLATLPGAENKAAQFSKALIGSAIFAGAASLAFGGKATWAAPTTEKEKELFYASGRQAYSLKIGDKWVSYSRLGPLAYPIAMAAALQWYENENPGRFNQTQLEKASRVLSGVATFFSDQSYMQGLGNFVDAARGDTTAISRALANFPSQVVPLSSLDRWVSQLIDPVYRKTSSKLSVDAIIQNLQSGIPGLSQNLPAYKTPAGTDSKRAMPGFNAFSPLTVSPLNKSFEGRLKGYRKGQEVKAKAKSGGNGGLNLNFGG